MKKLIALLLFICLLPLCALSEMDEDGDVVVTLDGMELFFTPIEGHCITRKSVPAKFMLAGLDRQKTLALMEAQEVYALLFDAADTCEIQVIAYESVKTDFDEMTDHGAELMRSDVVYVYEDQGYDVSWAEIYRAPEGHTFVRMLISWTEEDGTEEYTLTYITCQAGYTVGLNLYTYESMVTDSHLEAAELLADSLWIKATK